MLESGTHSGQVVSSWDPIILMYTCLDCGRKPEEQQQWNQQVIKGNWFYCCYGLLKTAPCCVLAPNLSKKILLAGFVGSFYTTHKPPSYERENVSQRSEVTAKLSITAALVRHCGQVPQLCPCSLNPSISKTGADVHLQALGTGAGGSTIVQMPSLREIGTVGGGGRGRVSAGSVQHFSPLLSSTSYWSPKGSGLQVSPSEVLGSHFVSWIWNSATLWGPSGQTYWTPNKRACWEGAY